MLRKFGIIVVVFLQLWPAIFCGYEVMAHGMNVVVSNVNISILLVTIGVLSVLITIDLIVFCRKIWKSLPKIPLWVL